VLHIVEITGLEMKREGSMHLVPAPAVRLMKSRVTSRPGNKVYNLEFFFYVSYAYNRLFSMTWASGTAQINAQINRESTIHAWFNQWWKRPRDTQLERDYRRMNSWFSTLFLFLFLLFLNAFRSSLLFLSTAMIENLM
jgi:hypothetical protein